MDANHRQFDKLLFCLISLFDSRLNALLIKLNVPRPIYKCTPVANYFILFVDYFSTLETTPWAFCKRRLMVQIRASSDVEAPVQNEPGYEH